MFKYRWCAVMDRGGLGHDYQFETKSMRVAVSKVSCRVNISKNQPNVLVVHAEPTSIPRNINVDYFIVYQYQMP